MPPAVDGTQLALVPHQDHLGSSVSGGRYQFVQGERPDQAGFIDDHQLACAKPPAGHFAFVP